MRTIHTDRPRPTFRRTLTRALSVPAGLAVGAGLTAAALHVGLLPSTTAGAVEAHPGATATPDPAAAKVARLFDAHDCWTGEPPADLAGSIPPAALVTYPNGRVAYGPAHVGPALDHLFAGKRPGLTVHGFCR